MMAPGSVLPSLLNNKFAVGLETFKVMSTNKKLIAGLVLLISVSLVGCGGGGASAPCNPEQPGHTSNPHPTGMWSTLSYTMPINPIHAALLHTGKVLIVSGSGNDSTNTNYRAALWDPKSGAPAVQGVPWDMFCNGTI